MNKIKNLSIKGLRGIKKEISFPLNGKSILLYGENGSGKSSVTDAIEWFYYDKIGHLTGEEIGKSKKGIEGLRNIHINDQDDGILSIDYTKPELNSSKKIYIKNSKLDTQYSNDSTEFLKLLLDAQKEQIILRYRDLVKFILASKTEKLNELSKIIGFSDVIKTRDVLKKTPSAIKREIKNSNFAQQQSNQDQLILEQLGQNIVSDSQYFDTINSLLHTIQIDKKATTFKELDDILELIKKPEDTQYVEQQIYLEKVKGSAKQIIDINKNINTQYEKYYSQYQSIVSDIDKLNKIKLESLLSEGVNILKEDIIKDEICPLCQQPQNKLELLKDLQNRLEELQSYKEEKIKLDEVKSSLYECITKAENIITNILSDSYTDKEDNHKIKSSLSKVEKGLKNYKSEAERDILSHEKVKESNQLIIKKDNLEEITSFASNRIQDLKAHLTKDMKSEVRVKIELSKRAYLEIKRLKKAKELLENQQYSLEKLNSLFTEKMEEGFNVFLSHLSNDINDLYVFMNHGEDIADIKLITLQKNDEFSGITIQFKFYEDEVTPPDKYLSESHLNCLGIAFFLTSVMTFNKNNKFFVLDDVISSFDTIHRTRFANLLMEKFSDYQIILMTHEKDWFEYVSKLVKGKNWLINTFRYIDTEGPTIDLPLPSLKEQIENQISQNDVDGLGNKIRKYLECLLKEMSNKIGIYMRFRYNDKNEDRMPNELLTSLKSYLNKHTNVTIDSNLVDRLISSVFIGNKDSHDSSYKVSVGDCKAFWADVIELENQYRNYIN